MVGVPPAKETRVSIELATGLLIEGGRLFPAPGAVLTLGTTRGGRGSS